MILKNGKVLSGDFRFYASTVHIKDGRISSLSLHDTKETDDVLDVSGLMVLPGLIDIHTHGCVGYDTMDAAYEALQRISVFMAQNGVTSFLPTTITESDAALKKAVSNVKVTVKKGVAGASILGIAMEGPYFSQKYKGAHNAQYFKDPSFQEFSRLNSYCDNLIKIVHVAPEREGAMEFIRSCSKEGIVVSLGHSEADYETVRKAKEHGATQLTHIFNGMAGLHHRQPGFIGAALDTNLMVEMICDGQHLHPAVIRMLYKLFGAENMILISDSIRATGLNDGVYDFGGQKMTVNNGIAKMEDGALAGGTTPLLGCVKKAVEFGIPLEDAIKMATINPAKAIGQDSVIGSIMEGKSADLIVVNEKLEVVYTFIQGRMISNL